MQQEYDNMVRWDKRLRPFYEVFFLKCNIENSPYALWLRYTLLAPQKNLGAPSAAVWAMFFDSSNPLNNIAVKETVGVDRTIIEPDIFYFQILENAIYNSGARGQVSSGGNSIKWDLQFIHNEESFRLYPASFYYLPFPKTKLIAPNWSVRIAGEIDVGGKSHPFKESKGCQAHLWGSRQGERWAWAHCNTFQEDPEAVFEALTAQVRFGKKLSRPLTLFCLKLGDGRILKFNRISQLFFNKSRYDLNVWELSGERGHYRIKAALKNRPQEMMGVTYTDTDGSKLYCYHSESTDFHLELYEQHGSQFRLTKTLTSPQAGAFEIVERAPVPGVSLQI